MINEFVSIFIIKNIKIKWVGWRGIKMDRDLVSILIPAYKPQHFFECLSSAIAQTWKNREIIVSDDSAGDDIRNICDKFGSHFVKYIKNPNPGVHNNLDLLLNVSKGEYIKFLFDDDILNPLCVEYLYDSLKQFENLDAKIAFSPRQIIDADNKSIQLYNYFSPQKIELIQGRELVKTMALNLTNPVGELTTILFKRSSIMTESGRSVLGYLDKRKWMGLVDVALFTQVSLNGNAVVCPEILSLFRIHESSNTNPLNNIYWIDTLVDWKNLVDFSVKSNILEGEEIHAAYLWLEFNIKIWIQIYPSHKPRLDILLAQVDDVIDRRSITPFVRNFLIEKGVIETKPHKDHIFKFLLGIRHFFYKNVDR